MSVPDPAGLFDRHHLAVFRFLRRMTGSSSAAEDLTQEVFLRVVRGAERYEERTREISWVFRIARNVLVDRHRAEARAPERIAIEDGGPYAIPAVSFDYGQFRSQLHGVPLPKRPIPTSDVMEMTVSGSVRSRIQADGSIELFLVAFRTARPSDGRWATAAHGQKRVQATRGETLRLELPPPTNFEGANEPETFQAIAEQRVSLVLTPTLLE
jgi:RNA polymerase sigma factor (sigma-70 family)